MKQPIVLLFCLAFGLGLVMVFVTMLWNLRGKPNHSHLMMIERIAEFLFKVVGGLIFVVGSIAVVQQSLVRGTDWFKFRMAHEGRFIALVALAALTGLRMIQKSIRELRRKKNPHA